MGIHFFNDKILHWSKNLVRLELQFIMTDRDIYVKEFLNWSQAKIKISKDSKINNL